MLTTEEAEALGRRLGELECNNPAAGDGLFTYVFKKEPAEEAARYEFHLRECEFCRIALQVYRYKRDVAEALGRETGDDRLRAQPAVGSNHLHPADAEGHQKVVPEDDGK